MQLYALDADTAILADEAKRGYNYRCFECKEPLRVRGGPHRHLHFYHLEGKTTCRQEQKSISHILFQCFLQFLLPKEEVVVEKFFPSIRRIADLFWEKHNLVIEIQYSPLSLEEAKKRTEAYESLNLKILWILSDARYNKKNLSPAEAYLRKKNCYFTSFKEENPSTLMVYDQFEYKEKHKRFNKSSPFCVDITQLQIAPIPLYLKKFFPERTFYFKGDCVDSFSKEDESHPFLLPYKKGKKRKIKLMFLIHYWYHYLIKHLLKSV